jgi:hypothetical protein
MMLKRLCSLALISGLACLRPLPVASQAVTSGNPSLLGTWKAISVVNHDTTTLLMAFQSNGTGYSAYSPGYAKNPFTYSFSKPNRILVTSGKSKPHRYSIEFITPHKVHLLTYPPPTEPQEEISLLEAVIFQRQSSASTNSIRPATEKAPK